MKKNSKGFTLVELLVVIAIIGILAVVAVPSLMKNIDKGKAADIVAECNAIRTAAITRYADTGTLAITSASDLDGYLDNLDKSKYLVKGTAAVTSPAESVADAKLTIVVKNANKGTVLQRVANELGSSASLVRASLSTDATGADTTGITVEFTLK